MNWATVYPEFQRAKEATGVKPELYAIADANLRRSLREQYLPAIDEGIGMLQSALQIDPGYDDAMAYTNLLYRLKSGLVDSPAESAELIAKADEWVGKALATRRQRAQGQDSEPSQLNVEGPPPGPEGGSRMIKAPPPPPPPAPPGDRIASALPPMKPRTAEQQAPYWQVAGKGDVLAMTLFRDLQSKGFRAALFASKEDNLVRVMVGPYFDSQSLEKAKTEIESAGFHALRIW
jgi:cell division septation protein DedD